MKVVTYYVNSSTGCDRNPGTSPEQPFKTLSAVNALTLEPGDRVLLARGCVFENQYLHLRARGTKEAPVTVESYGEGTLPHIKASGTGLWYQNYGQPLDNPNHVWHGYVSSAVLLYDCEYIRLRDLEISNDPGLLPGERYNQGDKMNRTGVAVVAQNRGTLHGITLTGLHVHDVKGNVYDKHLANGGGCVMFCLGESVNNTFRYNISFLDGDGILNPCENPDAHIYGNTFIMAPEVPFVRHNMSGGHMLVENNLIVNLGHQPVSCDRHHGQLGLLSLAHC